MSDILETIQQTNDVLTSMELALPNLQQRMRERKEAISLLMECLENEEGSDLFQSKVEKFLRRVYGA